MIRLPLVTKVDGCNTLFMDTYEWEGETRYCTNAAIYWVAERAAYWLSGFVPWLVPLKWAKRLHDVVENKQYKMSLHRDHTLFFTWTDRYDITANVVSTIQAVIDKRTVIGRVLKSGNDLYFASEALKRVDEMRKTKKGGA